MDNIYWIYMGIYSYIWVYIGTRVSLNWGVEYELSPILGPVQNQILYSRGPLCVGTLRNSVSKSQAYQENPLDIGLETLPVFVFNSP